MSSIAPLLVAASAAVVLLLGLIHLLYTFHGTFLLSLGLLLLVGYIFLAKRYWFRAPLGGILLATFLYALALIVSRI